jgi:WD40 repeat protein
VFSPDGQTLLSASSDKTLKIWDVATGQEIYSVKLPWRPFSVSISPTKPNRVITANANGTLTMFEFEEINK